MGAPARPTNIIWDITYACPLRCIHCYSESGRRPTRQLSLNEQLRVADSIIELQPKMVALAGGEPLVVKGIFEVADRLSRAGIHVVCYSGGWPMKPDMVEKLMRCCATVTISLDGPTARVHDRIRGRAGSFDRAMAALRMLDDAVLDDGPPGFRFGIDTVVVRSNFEVHEEMCTSIAPRFPALKFLDLGAVIPAGLASRPGFAEHELLSDAQVEQLGSAAWTRHLRSLAPPSVTVTCTDNLDLRMKPDQGIDNFTALQIEPDGEVRAMPIYEGTVGSLLHESGETLWHRAIERWSHPFVTEILSSVHTVEEWSEAARRIDYHFGSEAVRARIDRRPGFTGACV
ncbi:radical SAM protein [Amycolatopsis regifaucium]|uniref:Radical SAM protein n=1 Tax=Amycolatopsis regifaucium TaxID=546365 RepID=A0A154MQP8_9PSEU|nr:radical SAM protein [Amycolatopsis regifaucium]KZB86253.1 radical SAM protein [Amycolatopsis regifaucium]OKA05146.1 radical SAM protein [Amycolatopsis regifaucium]SFH83566.1 Radical SAM superfamily enzyme, MoaA/NifB/PqqE/SkfB family [Amycolatopsis regifaucium]